VIRKALRIGGVTLAVESEEPFDFPDPSSRFAVSGDVVADVALTATRGTPRMPSGDIVFDSGGVWRLHAEDDRRVFTFHSPYFQSDPYKTASFDADFTRGEVVVANDAPYDPLGYPLDELLVAARLSWGAGVELHGVGMIVDGRGYLFVGQSGAGKTTTARLWLKESAPVILSDDRIIVRRDPDGGLRMYGTPWHGEAEICAAADAPLAAIYLLEQAPATAIRELEDAEGVARLFACAFPPFYHQESLGFTITFLGTLLSERVVRALAFTPDGSAVRAVLNPR